MLTKEQLAARKVGGSDIATILGFNPYKTELELYFEKIGEIPPEDLSQNLAVMAGNIYEDPTAEFTARRLSMLWGREVKLRRCNLTLTHPKYDWLTCHIDRDVVGLERGVECKEIGPWGAIGWGKDLSDSEGVPDLYKPQPHAYMLVKDYPVWTVAAHFGGYDLRLYEMERSKAWDELIVEATHDFWYGHVLKGIPPDATNVPERRRLEVAKRVYPGTTGEYLEAELMHDTVPVILEGGQPALVSLPTAKLLYDEACAKEKAAKLVTERLKGDLLLAMGNAAVLAFPDGSQLVRKEQKRKGYTVEAKVFIDARFKKPRKGKEEDSNDDSSE